MGRWRRWRPPTSFQQNILLHYVREIYPYPFSLLNYRVRIVGKRKSRWVDIGIPSLKVGIEYDGQKTHANPSGRKRDKERDAELKAMGWRVIHVNKFNWKFFHANMKTIINGTLELPKVVTV